MFTYNVHYIAAILLLTMLSFLFICTELVSVNAIASRNVLRVSDSLITQMLLSKHSFCAFSPQRPLYVLVCILFCSVDCKRYYLCF